MSTLTQKKVLQAVRAAQKQGNTPDFSGTDLSQVDLSGVNLTGAYFIEANLSQVNFNQANLVGANLSQADLSGAHLRRVNFGGANLSRANLSQANLSGAYLSRANLRGADLGGANLVEANLSQANLSGANLSGTDLSGADLGQAELIWADFDQALLNGVNLSQTDLTEADLSQASLRGANLSEADLFRANLSQADLSQANLIWADLCQANLSGVSLNQANLNRARLDGADFSRAVIGLTSFGDVALNAVKGLDCVEHLGPSTVGLDTLSRSRGQIPDVFLRGCGLSDVQIETAKFNNPDLPFDQIMAITNKIHELLLEQTTLSCFISYAREDEVFAQQLHNDLQQNGIRCWFSAEAMKFGNDKGRPTIDYASRLYDKLLLILSECSINRSWIKREVEDAFKEEDRRTEMVLFPVQLDETVLETDQAWATDIRRTRHVGDFSQWQDQEVYQQSLTQLLRDLTVKEE
ncbi:MAG: toll/interleukin-1 receptor domain-containing protein [Anaerolineae bacterium]|nr:toll/interleukin-1 receptor domain-containing protein [Anaerolineae bacterium]